MTKKKKYPYSKRRKANVLLTSGTKRIDGKLYGSNIGYKSKTRAKLEAKKCRNSGKYSSVRVKPKSLYDSKGKHKSKFHVIYVRKKGLR